jgi:hypothetical protein
MPSVKRSLLPINEEAQTMVDRLVRENLPKATKRYLVGERERLITALTLIQAFCEERRHAGWEDRGDDFGKLADIAAGALP